MGTLHVSVYMIKPLWILRFGQLSVLVLEWCWGILGRSEVPDQSSTKAGNNRGVEKLQLYILNIELPQEDKVQRFWKVWKP